MNLIPPYLQIPLYSSSCCHIIKLLTCFGIAGHLFLINDNFLFDVTGTEFPGVFIDPFLQRLLVLGDEIERMIDVIQAKVLKKLKLDSLPNGVSKTSIISVGA